MATLNGYLCYRDTEGREYRFPYPYRPDVFVETCRRVGWAYRQVPFVPIGYTGYYVQWGYLIYLLDMDTPSKYGFGSGRRQIR